MRAGRIIATALVAGLAAGAAGAGNLLTNPNFDNDGNGWLLIDNDQMETFFREDVGSTLVGGSGPGAIEVRLMSHAGWSGTFQANVAIEGGLEYRVEVSVMVPSAGNSLNGIIMFLELFDASSARVATLEVADWEPVFDQWVRLSGTLAAPSGAETARLWMGVLPSPSEQETNPAVAVYDDAFLGSDDAASVTQILFVPAVAAVNGLNETYWSTDGWFSNLTEVTVTLEGAFLHEGQDNTGAVTNPMSLGTIPAGGFLRRTDIVSMLGISEKAGGLYLRASGAGAGLPTDLVRATTHTFTPNPFGDGVYGQGIPAVPAGTLGRVVVPGVFQGSALRSNVGALNTSGGPITLSVTILNGAGAQETAVNWTLEPYEQWQVSLPSLGVSSLDGGTVLFVLSGTGSFRGYTSTVDQRSGDAVYNEAR